MKKKSKISEAELKRRKAELGQLARKELAKTEIMRFRMEPRDILRLFDIAKQKRQHTGSMVRQWVLERMEIESHPGARASNVSAVAETSSAYSSTYLRSNIPSGDLLNTILLRLASLEADIKRLSKHR